MDGTGHMLSHITLFKFIAKKSLGPFFPALPQSTRVPHSVTSLLHSWPRDMLATPAWASAIPFRESSFVMLVPLRILPASSVFAHLQLSRYGTLCQHFDTLQIRIPLFLSSLLRWLTSHVLI